MVKAAAVGQDVAAIAACSGRTVRTVKRWLRRYGAGGVAAVADAPRAGRPPRADAAYRQALERAVETGPRDLGLPFDVWTSARLSAYLAQTRGGASHRAGYGCCWRSRTAPVGGPSTPWGTCKIPPPWPPVRRSGRRRKKKVAAEPDKYELHYQDETHRETNPYLCQVWHRRGVQPTRPAAGTNRRVTVFGRVETLGRGRVEVLCAGQDSACFLLYLEALEHRYVATGKEMYLVLDNGPAHTSKVSRAALEERAGGLHGIWLARYSPELNPKEQEWKVLKRDVRSHLAATLRAFVDESGAGLRQLGGARIDVVDPVPDGFIAGHRKEPTGRPPGRPKGAKDSYTRAPYRKKEAQRQVAA